MKSKIVYTMVSSNNNKMKIILIIILICFSLISYSQTDAEKINEQFEKFKKYYQKEKFEKAAQYYEWLMETSSTFDEEFYQSGILMYDYLYSTNQDYLSKVHYKSMLDTLKTIVGKDVDDIYNERFEIYGQHVKKVNFEPIDGKTYDYDIEPQYPDGLGSFLNLVVKEMKKSPVLKNYRNREKGYVEFVVNDDGKIINVRMVKGFKPDIDNEIVRIIGSLPNWIPAKKNGESVAARMILPINFE